MGIRPPHTRLSCSQRLARILREDPLNIRKAWLGPIVPWATLASAFLAIFVLGRAPDMAHHPGWRVSAHVLQLALTVVALLPLIGSTLLGTLPPSILRSHRLRARTEGRSDDDRVPCRRRLGRQSSPSRAQARPSTTPAPRIAAAISRQTLSPRVATARGRVLNDCLAKREVLDTTRLTEKPRRPRPPGCRLPRTQKGTS
jgi:hypothetical protein